MYFFLEKKKKKNGPNPERRVFYTAKRPSKIHDLMRKSSLEKEIFLYPNRPILRFNLLLFIVSLEN